MSHYSQASQVPIYNLAKGTAPRESQFGLKAPSPLDPRQIPPVTLTTSSSDDHHTTMAPDPIEYTPRETPCYHPSNDPNTVRPSAALDVRPYQPTIRRARSCLLGEEANTQQYIYNTQTSFSQTSDALSLGSTNLEYASLTPNAGEASARAISSTLGQLNEEDCYQLWADASNLYIESSRMAVLVKRMEEENVRIAEATEAARKSSSRRWMNMSFLSPSSSKKASKTPPGSPTGRAPLQDLSLPTSTQRQLNQIIAGTRKTTSFDILGPPLEFMLPADWDPLSSTGSFLIDPDHDASSRVTLLPRGTRFQSAPGGFPAVPSRRIWGTGPTVEFIVLPSQQGPAVVDCRNNRRLSDALAVEFKTLRERADQEFQLEKLQTCGQF